MSDESKGQPGSLEHGWLLSRFRNPWAAALFLAAIGFIVRMPALQGEPVWDDDYLIRTNPFIKSPLLILEAFRHYLFLDTYSAHYRPIQNLSYMADYLFWNANFYGFHLSSLLLHIGSGVLLYFLLGKLLTLLQQRLSPGQNPLPVPLIAFLVALLWVVHPVHSAAVDYVSGRADSLSFGFACVAWLLFLKGRECNTRGSRVVLFASAFLAALLSLCSRESGCIWIAIFLLYLFAFDKPVKPIGKWLALGCCVAVLGLYLGLRQLPGAAYIPPRSSEGITPALRVVLMLRSLGDYGRLMLFPANLHMERTVYLPKAFQNESGRRDGIEHEYLSIGGLVFLAGLIILSSRRGRGQWLRALGAGWFFVAYLPFSNLIDLNATVAEHWLYLSSVGFLLFLAGCVLDLPLLYQRAAVYLACMAALGLGVRSAYRSSDWVSNEIFARRTLISGGTTLRTVLLLAQVYTQRKDYPAAERLLRKAVHLCPDYASARNNLADALAHEGKKKEAEALFTRATEASREARKEYPRTWIAALNLSQLQHSQHQDAVAIAILDKARSDYPGTWELISAESELLREQNQNKAARDLIEPFARNHWWHYQAWAAMGRLLAQEGDSEAALPILRHASRLDVHETAALNLVALIQLGSDRLEEACLTQRRAVARQPDQPRQYLLLSQILERMGRNKEANDVLAQVTRLRRLADSGPAAN